MSRFSAVNAAPIDSIIGCVAAAHQAPFTATLKINTTKMMLQHFILLLLTII